MLQNVVALGGRTWQIAENPVRMSPGTELAEPRTVRVGANSVEMLTPLAKYSTDKAVTLATYGGGFSSQCRHVQHFDSGGGSF